VPPEIPVLIVGGGPIGLTTSLLLSHHGIRSLLVEQHPGTSIYPKARFIKARTMEIFRQLGIEQAIREVAIPHARNAIWARCLAGEELLRRPIETAIPDSDHDWSPTWGCTSTQDVIEPVLLEHARRCARAQVRFNTQLASFEQREDHVLATLVHRLSGRVISVRAQYLVGADGSHSPTREALGIRMLGQPILAYRVHILFRGELSPWVGDREINMGFIVNPEAAGLLLYNGGDRWLFTFFYHPDRGQRPEDFTPERCRQIIRTAIGVPELAVELGEITPWCDSALVAERFYDRRVFLAGDATHVMSPAGGFAMNVGVADAHNLAWKLAAVLKGWAAPALLDSYQAERAPISRRMTEQMAINLGVFSSTADAAGSNSASSRPAAQLPLTRPGHFREHGLVFGHTYDSAIIVPDGTAPVQVEDPVTDYVPNARPGSRAPHIWLERGGTQISTLDLFGSGLVVLAGGAGRDWGVAAREFAEKQGIPLAAYTIGAQGDFCCADHLRKATYGIEDDGAVLVRPDGYVAWRSPSGNSDMQRQMNRAIRLAIGKQLSELS
jgi:putative polyketide hydroxylase